MRIITTSCSTNRPLKWLWISAFAPVSPRKSEIHKKLAERRWRHAVTCQSNKDTGVKTEPRTRKVGAGRPSQLMLPWCFRLFVANFYHQCLKTQKLSLTTIINVVNTSHEMQQELLLLLIHPIPMKANYPTHENQSLIQS